MFERCNFILASIAFTYNRGLQIMLFHLDVYQQLLFFVKGMAYLSRMPLAIH